MAVARYWRMALYPKVPGGPLEMSSLQLYVVATRVDAAATLTSDIAPTSGSLANLKDANLSTDALWGAVSNRVVFSWDFGGSPVDVTGFGLGSADTESNFPRHATLEYSSDSVSWSTIDYSVERGATDYKYLIWPGVRVLSAGYVVSRWSKANYSRQTQVDGTTGNVTFSNGNKTYSAQATSNLERYFLGEVGRRTGVRQFECTRILGATATAAVGIRNSASTERKAGDGPSDWVYKNDGNKVNNAVSVAYGAAWTATSDVIGVVVDFTAGTVTFYKNGVSQGVAYTSVAIAGVVAYPLSGPTASSGANGFTLECETFAYPIAGATAWGGNTYPAIETWSTTGTPVAPVFTGTLYAAPGYTGVARTVLASAAYDYRFRNWGGQVYGTVKVDGTPTDAPVRRRVRLFRDLDGILIQEKWSNATTGAYSFQYLETEHTYTVLSDDYTASFRTVVADKIVPEAMP